MITYEADWSYQPKRAARDGSPAVICARICARLRQAGLHVGRAAASRGRAQLPLRALDIGVSISATRAIFHADSHSSPSIALMPKAPVSRLNG